MKKYDLATGVTEHQFIANLNRIAAMGFEVDNGVDVAVGEDGLIFSALMVSDIPDAKPATEPSSVETSKYTGAITKDGVLHLFESADDMRQAMLAWNGKWSHSVWLEGVTFHGKGKSEPQADVTKEQVDAAVKFISELPEPQAEPVHPDAPPELWTVKRIGNPLVERLHEDGYYATEAEASDFRETISSDGDNWKVIRVK